MSRWGFCEAPVQVKGLHVRVYWDCENYMMLEKFRHEKYISEICDTCEFYVPRPEVPQLIGIEKGRVTYYVDA